MYVEYHPKWLWESYHSLRKEKGRKEFEFKEALRILKVSKQMLLKTLSELEKRGLLIKWRSEYEQRIKKYRLVSKEAVRFVEDLVEKVGETRKKSQLSLIEKLQIVTKFLKQQEKSGWMRYLITNSNATFYYHKYIIPPKVLNIKILNEDMDKWVFFLTDENTRVYGWTEKGDIPIPSSERHKFIVRLHKWLSDQEYERAEESRGLLYQAKEDLILELVKKRTRLSLTEAAAVILTSKMNWDRLKEVFRDSPQQRGLGALLDIIYSTNKRLVPVKFIRELKKKVKGKISQPFPADVITEEEYSELVKKKQLGKIPEKDIKKFFYYQDLSQKWGLPIIMPAEAVKKIFKDLRVKYGRY